MADVYAADPHKQSCLLGSHSRRTEQSPAKTEITHSEARCRLRYGIAN